MMPAPLAHHCFGKRAMIRAITTLMEPARRGEPGLSNEAIRRITHYSRAHVKRLITELKTENAVILKGSGQGARL